MSYVDIIKKQIQDSVCTKEKLLNDDTLIKRIEEVAHLMVECYKNGGKVIFAGNGGSAADAQHLAGELVSKFYFDRPALASIALTVDTSIITAIGNDYGYDMVFTRQLQANATSKDIFVGITTSGNSKNVIKAFEYARSVGIKTVCLNGSCGGLIEKNNLVDYDLIMPSCETPRVQECHTLVGHILCGLIEGEIFKSWKR